MSGLTGTVERGPSTDEGTFGKFTAFNGWTCAWMEKPWRNNEHGKSSLPLGVYLLEWDNSPSKGWCYHFRNVPGRDHVLLHSANLAGDMDKGWASELEGCSAPGAEVVTFMAGVTVGAHVLTRTQRGVSASKQTLAALLTQFRDPVTGIQLPFSLKIT